MSPAARVFALSAVLALGAAAVVALPLGAGAGAEPGASRQGFVRLDVDTGVGGAAFTSVGELFPGERNIVTSGYGELVNGVPAGGGTLQVYRPGRSLAEWHKVEVFGADEGIIFPNRATVADVDGDGLNDLVVPSGYFFDTNPSNDGGAQARSAITWWKNLGVDGAGKARGFTRHDLVTGQGPSYHGVEVVDLDGDGVPDLVTTAEAGRVADDQSDDTVRLQYLRGLGEARFAAPVTLAEGTGGSLPTVADVDGDGRQDIVSAQYFNLTYTDGDAPSFMWFRQSGDASSGLTAANFTQHPVATFRQAGFGFQIRPVPGFRAPGTVSWIGTNHQGRCFVQRFLSTVIPGAIDVPEMVMEFVPGADPTAPWTVKELSVPVTPAADPTGCDPAFNVRNSPVAIHPTDHITSRSAAGQAAPGVFGYGDLDGDGDIDLAVSGDGDRRLFWVERRPGEAQDTVLHTLTAPGEEFGQSGGAVVEDLDGDGVLELVFSSFDKNTVALWTRGAAAQPPAPVPSATPPPSAAPTSPPTAVTRRTRLKATSHGKRPVAGRASTWRIRLSGTQPGKRRLVTATFRATGAKRARQVGSVRLRPREGGGHAGRLTWRPRRSGKLVLRYAGGEISALVLERASHTKVRVQVRARR